jgi:hypothetical protein
MSFYDSISNFFGFTRDPEKGKWPRKVGLNELPPERLPKLPPHLRPPLPQGLREVTGPDHEGWQPWSKPQPPARDSVDDFLRDGAVEPPKRRGQ